MSYCDRKPAAEIRADAGKGKDPAAKIRMDAEEDKGQAAKIRDCCAVLLRGGRSRRMGQDKALLPWGGGTFLQAVAACLEMFPEKYLSVAYGIGTGGSVGGEESGGGKGFADEKGSADREGSVGGKKADGAEKPVGGEEPAGTGQQAGSARLYGLSEDWVVLPDRLPGCGPMGGIWTALLTCKSRWALITSCDIPALGQSLLLRLLEGRGEDVDLVCPVTPDGRMHLTCALYSRTLAPQIGERIREGDFRLRSLADRCRTKRIPITDPAMIRMLTNVNTEADLALFACLRFE